MATFSFVNWLTNMKANLLATRRSKPLSVVWTIPSTRLDVEALEGRTVPTAIIYQLTPYGSGSFGISGTITADGVVGGTIGAADVSSWTVNITNLSTNATTQYSGTGSEIVVVTSSTPNLLFDATTLRQATGRGPGFVEFFSSGVSILKEEVYVVTTAARNFRVITEFGNIFESGPHFNNFFPQLAFGGVPANTPPEASDDTPSIDEDHADTFNVLTNDSDSENNIEPTQTVNLTSPTAGILTNNHDGTFNFDPAGAFDYLAVGESTTVSFDYQVFDAFGESDIGTVTITIIGVNDEPSVAATNSSVTVNEGSPATNSGTFADIDLSDRPTITASIGTITQDANNSGAWSWSYTPANGPSDSQTVTITADDHHGGIAQTTFVLDVKSVAPLPSVALPAGVLPTSPSGGITSQQLAITLAIDVPVPVVFPSDPLGPTPLSITPDTTVPTTFATPRLSASAGVGGRGQPVAPVDEFFGLLGASKKDYAGGLPPGLLGRIRTPDNTSSRSERLLPFEISQKMLNESQINEADENPESWMRWVNDIPPTGPSKALSSFTLPQVDAPQVDVPQVDAPQVDAPARPERATSFYWFTPLALLLLVPWRRRNDRLAKCNRD